MAWTIVTLCLLVTLLPEIRTQAPPAGGATQRVTSTITSSPQHPFCTQPPVPKRPTMPMFDINVKTGFYNGFRSNQSVIVEVTAKYPEMFPIKQVFIEVPDTIAHSYRHRPHNYYQPKFVGHWAWNLQGQSGPGGLQTPGTTGTQPVDCGGVTSYGPFGMLSRLGAHAAMQVARNDDPMQKGFGKVVAKWVPPSNFHEIMNRKEVTIEAYVTFEKTPPGTAHHYQYSYGHHHRHRPRPARWVKKEARILNLDYIDIHNYLIMTFGPNYRRFFGPPAPVVTSAPPREL